MEQNLCADDEEEDEEKEGEKEKEKEKEKDIDKNKDKGCEKIIKNNKNDKNDNDKNDNDKKLNEENKLIIDQNIPICGQIMKDPQKEKTSKAYKRFKKAISQQKEKENDTTGRKANNEKIFSIASKLQEHIIKPLNEMEGKKNEREKIYRGGSVECRNSIVDNKIVKLLENAPVTKKHIKKPKFNKFAL